MAEENNSSFYSGFKKYALVGLMAIGGLIGKSNAQTGNPVQDMETIRTEMGKLTADGDVSIEDDLRLREVADSLGAKLNTIFKERGATEGLERILYDGDMSYFVGVEKDGMVCELSALTPEGKEMIQEYNETRQTVGAMVEEVQKSGGISEQKLVEFQKKADEAGYTLTDVNYDSSTDELTYTLGKNGNEGRSLPSTVEGVKQVGKGAFSKDTTPNNMLRNGKEIICNGR